jgi:hypothetical protein
MTVTQSFNHVAAENRSTLAITPHVGQLSWGLGRTSTRMCRIWLMRYRGRHDITVALPYGLLWLCHPLNDGQSVTDLLTDSRGCPKSSN